MSRPAWICLDPPALPPAVFDGLMRESCAQRQVAWACVRAGDDGPARQRNHRAELGPRARAALRLPIITRALDEVAGGPVALSPEASCYTYYDEPGDFLALHRDRPQACALTVLVYLSARGSAGAGRYLLVHGEEGVSSLAARAEPNRVLVMRGAELLHERPPIAAGEAVSLLSACYRFGGSTP
ncbi:MAG: hypothetical protein H6713_24150 [Myxococcales bacterium]|nr:hypothetical protein [Myxococcales bacterium]